MQNEIIYSDCCSADITMQDQNGHGKCTDCFENCTPVEDMRHPHTFNPILLALILILLLFFITA